MKPLTEVRDSRGQPNYLMLPKRRLASSPWITTILSLAIGLSVLIVLDNAQKANALTLANTRPVVQVSGLVTGVVAFLGVTVFGNAVVKRHQQIAWRVSLQMIGWIGLVGSVGAVIALIFQAEPTDGPIISGALRTVESVIPLVIGIQTAFLLSTDDEPGIEVLLACPRPISWVLLERLTVVFLVQSLVAVVGMAVSLAISRDQNVLIMAARWFPAALFFSGIAAYATLASRQPAFSVSVIAILWFVFRFMGGALLPGLPTFWPLNLIQPFIWAIHPYLQQHDLTIGDWWLNRALVAALGIIFIMMTVGKLRDEEQVLLGAGKSRKKATEGT